MSHKPILVGLFPPAHHHIPFWNDNHQNIAEYLVLSTALPKSLRRSYVSSQLASITVAQLISGKKDWKLL